MQLPKLDVHKPSTQAGLAAAGAVVAYALYKRRKGSSASSGSSAGTSSQLSGTDPLASAALSEASIEGNIVGDIQPQLDALSQQIANSKKPPTTTGGRGITDPVIKHGPALPKLNNNDFLQQIDRSHMGDLVALGTIGQGTVRGVTGGAPVYYLYPGQSVAVQGGPADKPAGTKEFTLKSLAGYIKP